jgi:hypothetical protein
MLNVAIGFTIFELRQGFYASSSIFMSERKTETKMATFCRIGDGAYDGRKRAVKLRDFQDLMLMFKQ